MKKLITIRKTCRLSFWRAGSGARGYSESLPRSGFTWFGWTRPFRQNRHRVAEAAVTNPCMWSMWAKACSTPLVRAVFTSPTPDQIEAATRAVTVERRSPHLKNYTGDIMNFEMAANSAGSGRGSAGGVINDDVAVEDSLYTAGRRGVGLTVRGKAVRCGGPTRLRSGALEALCAGQWERALHGDGPDFLHRPRAGKPTSSWAKTKWRWASASMVNRGASACPAARPGTDGAHGGECPGGPAVSRRRRSYRHGPTAWWHSVDGTLPRLWGVGADLARMGIRIARRLVGNYITSSKWPAAPSRCSSR